MPLVFDGDSLSVLNIKPITRRSRSRMGLPELPTAKVTSIKILPLLSWMPTTLASYFDQSLDSGCPIIEIAVPGEILPLWFVQG
jgi:hypothetical protein